MVSRVVNENIQGCVTCLMLIANGEDASLPDGGDAHSERMAAHYGNGILGLVCESGAGQPFELGFCSTPCEICGDTDGGDRFSFAELSQ